MEKIEFSYVAQNSKGAKIKGKIEASSEGSAYLALKSQGLIPLTLKPTSSGINTEISIPGFEKKVKTKELAVFTRQFSSLIKANMPLVKALTIVAAQTEGKRLQSSLKDVVRQIEGGSTLASAMAKHDDVFPRLVISLVRVGEEGGFLDKTLESSAINMKSEMELRGKIKSATTYPVVVGGVAVLCVALMLIFIVPTFSEMFAGAGEELPGPTRALVWLSDKMKVYFPIFLVVMGVFSFWYKKNKNKEGVRRVVDPMKLKIPVFGKLNSRVAVARFSRNLSMMLSAGVPLLSALELVGSTANNLVMEDAISEVREEMKLGKSFAKPLSKQKVFPDMVSSMSSVGEEAGTLPEMLDSIADYYDEEVKSTADSLSAAMNPILMVVLGVVIGGMMIAMYLPIFSMFKVMG